MDDIKVNDTVRVNYKDEDTSATVTHVRDTGDAPNTYRLLRNSDQWFLGWYTADQLTPDTAPDESEDESEDAEPEDGGPDDA